MQALQSDGSVRKGGRDSRCLHLLQKTIPTAQRHRAQACEEYLFRCNKTEGAQFVRSLVRVGWPRAGCRKTGQKCSRFLSRLPVPVFRLFLASWFCDAVLRAVPSLFSLVVRAELVLALLSCGPKSECRLFFRSFIFWSFFFRAPSRSSREAPKTANASDRAVGFGPNMAARVYVLLAAAAVLCALECTVDVLATSSGLLQDGHYAWYVFALFTSPLELC